MDTSVSYSGYALAFIWDTIAIYAVINSTLSIDTLFSWVMHNMSAQFRILNRRFKSLASTMGNTNSPGFRSDAKFCKSFAQCVTYHQGLLMLMETFNQVYMMIVFLKFLISCIQIAFLAFQFSRGGEFAGQLFHLFFLLSVSTQLLLYCYGGQRLKDEVGRIYIFLNHFYKMNYFLKFK